MFTHCTLCITFTAQTEEGSLSVDPTHLDGLESKELIGYFEGYMEETRVRMGSMKSSRQASVCVATGCACQWLWCCPCRKKKEEEEKCKCCRRMQEELESTHKMLNENGARQYGTLLREKISLQEQVCFVGGGLGRKCSDVSFPLLPGAR